MELTTNNPLWLPVKNKMALYAFNRAGLICTSFAIIVNTLIMHFKWMPTLFPPEYLLYQQLLQILLLLTPLPLLALIIYREKQITYFHILQKYRNWQSYPIRHMYQDERGDFQFFVQPNETRTQRMYILTLRPEQARVLMPLGKKSNLP